MAAPKGSIILAPSNNALSGGALSNDLLILVSNSNQSVSLGASNLSPWLRINSNGFIGIGKSNPAYTLDIAGNVNFVGALTSNGVPFVSGGGGGNGTGFSNNGSNLFVLAPSNIGIHVATPLAPLHIGSNVRIDGDFTISKNVQFNGLYLTPGSNGTNASQVIVNPGGGTQWSNNSSNIFVLGSNVGIGLSNAAAQLHVACNLRVDGSVQMGSYAMFGGINFSYGSTFSNSGGVILTSSNIQGYSNLVWGGSGSNGTQFSIMSNTVNDSFRWVSGAASNTLMTLTGNGLLGIGTSNPSEAFEVRGSNVKVGSNLYVMSNLGVGKSNPAYPLDVVGDINFTGTLRQNGTTYGGGSSAVVTAGGSNIVALPTYFQSNVYVTSLYVNGVLYAGLPANIVSSNARFPPATIPSSNSYWMYAGSVSNIVSACNSQNPTLPKYGTIVADQARGNGTYIVWMNGSYDVHSASNWVIGNGFNATQAFDNNMNTLWAAADGYWSGTTVPVGRSYIVFQCPNIMILQSYTMTVRNDGAYTQNPAAWSVLGGTVGGSYATNLTYDGVTYNATPVDTRTGITWTQGQQQTFTLAGSWTTRTGYTHYLISWQQTGPGNLVVLSDFYMTGFAYW